MPNLDNFTTALDFYDLLEVLVGLFMFLGLLFSFFRHFFRKEWRLYKNLQRPIMIITPSNSGGLIAGKGMELEIEKLKENKFFNISKKFSDYRNFDPQDNYCLVVLGYDKGMIGLDEILGKIKDLQIPLIVYTYGENTTALNSVDKEKFDSYPWTLFANFRLTLINSIFNTLATYPYGKRKNK